jgi:hypothetical protein
MAFHATSTWVEWAWRKTGGMATHTAPAAKASGRVAPTLRAQAAITAQPINRKGTWLLSSRRLSRCQMQFHTARSSMLWGLPCVQMLAVSSQARERS